jgi:hypothetical protein
MGKVYCKNCKWYKGKKYLCGNWKIKNGYQGVNPDISNKNNNCKHYRKKWYLFWIKESK